TLGGSLYLAFGPFRHRLPRILTRFAKISATLKLFSLSVLCGWGLWVNVHHDGPRAIRWLLTLVGLALLGCAVFIATRPVATPRRESRQSRRAREAQHARDARSKPRPRWPRLERLL